MEYMILLIITNLVTKHFWGRPDLINSSQTMTSRPRPASVSSAPASFLSHRSLGCKGFPLGQVRTVRKTTTLLGLRLNPEALATQDFRPNGRVFSGPKVFFGPVRKTGPTAHNMYPKRDSLLTPESLKTISNSSWFRPNSPPKRGHG